MSAREELDAIRTLISRGKIAEARTRSLTTVENHEVGEGLRAWAEILEQLGLGAHANKLWRRILSDPETDPATIQYALESLDEDGRSAEADEYLNRIVDRSDVPQLVLELRRDRLIASGQIIEARRFAEEHGLAQRRSGEVVGHPVDEDLEILVPDDAALLRFLDLFVGRENVHARQWVDPNGFSGYAPVRSPIDVSLLRNHLLGNVTLGTYLLRSDARVTFFVLDIDVRREILETNRSTREELCEVRRALDESTSAWRERLQRLGFDTVVEDSGHRGRHIWVFFKEAVRSLEVLKFGRRLLSAGAKGNQHGGISVEFFPKQFRHGPKGLGNLVKLPLGIHRVSGRRSVFLSDEGKKIEDPWCHLSNVSRADTTTFEDARERVERRAGRITTPELEPIQEIDPQRPPGASRVPARPSGPPWTRQHFHADLQIAAILNGCPLLLSLINNLWSGADGAYSEQLVLRHTLGHLPQAVSGVNAAFRRLPAVPDHHWLNSALGGPVMSCASIRKRLKSDPQVCQCEFTQASHSYPHPLLHAVDIPGSGLDVEEQNLRLAAEAWWMMQRDEAVDPDEKEALATWLDTALSDRTDSSVECKSGTLRRIVEEGVSALILEDRGGQDDDNAKRTQESKA